MSNEEIAESKQMDLLAIDVATTFVISRSGRIERENDPDRSPGPRLFFAGCASGNIVRVRHDLSDQTALDLLSIVDRERPWSDPEAQPHCLKDLIALMSRDLPVETVGTGIIYRLPHDLTYDAGSAIIRSDSLEAERMLSKLADEGMPQSLVDAGFVGISDFWEPWCIALEDQQIASIAFAARIGILGAEVGVYTFPGFRGRGFAAAVTACWSSLPSLSDRALFYSTQKTNYSSQRVACRLDLRRIGVSIRIN